MMFSKVISKNISISNAVHKVQKYIDKHYVLTALVLCSIWTAINIIRMIPPADTLVKANGSYLTNDSAYDTWSFSHFAYSDLFALYLVHHLYLHPLPYLHVTIEYQVFIGFYMWIFSFAPSATAYFVFSALGLGSCLFLSYLILYKLRSRQAYLLLFCPMLFGYELLNWDLLAIAFLLLGIYFRKRNRFGLSGIFLSIATFTKFFPGAYALFLILELLIEKKSRELKAFLTWFGLVAIVSNVPFMLLSFRRWSDFYRYNFNRPASSSVIQMIFPLNNQPVLIVEVLYYLVPICALVACLYLLAKSLNYITVTALFSISFFLVIKIFSPQYMLWVFVAAMLGGIPSLALFVISTFGLFDFLTVSILLVNWHSGIPQTIGLEFRYLAILIAFFFLLRNILRDLNDRQLLSQKAGIK